MGVFIFIMFLALLIMGREELGWKGISICFGLVLAICIGLAMFNISPWIFIGVLSVFDAVLFLVIFGSDITL